MQLSVYKPSEKQCLHLIIHGDFVTASNPLKELVAYEIFMNVVKGIECILHVSTKIKVMVRLKDAIW